MADNGIRTSWAFRAEIFEFEYQGFSANEISSHSKLMKQDMNRIALHYRRYGTALSSITSPQGRGNSAHPRSCMAVYETSLSWEIQVKFYLKTQYHLSIDSRFNFINVLIIYFTNGLLNHWRRESNEGNNGFQIVRPGSNIDLHTQPIYC